MFIKTRQKIFLASLLFRWVRFIRKLRGLTTKDVFHRKGLHWELDLEEGIDFAIYLWGAFEPELAKFFDRKVNPDDVVFDIGANIGAHTVHFANKISTGAGHVYAVEATHFAYDKLMRNLELNPGLLPHATVFHSILVAPGEQTKELEIFSSWPLLGKGERHAQHQGMSKSTGDAAMLTFDELVDGLKLERMNWIKIDVDGHELQVFEGALQTLKKYQPRIVIELAHDYDSDTGDKEFTEMVELLFELGYRLYTLAGKPLPTNAEDLVAYIPSGASMNAYAEISRG